MLFMVVMAEQVVRELNDVANPGKAQVLQKFFKTGKGSYGEGDIFLGVPVPVQRKIASKHNKLSLPELQQLLDSPVHEHRMTALLILILQYDKAEEQHKKQIIKFYLKNIKNINNWDLVDLSAPHILGNYLSTKKDHTMLYDLARSKNLWKRRIAIISTYAFIKQKKFTDTLKISKLLLTDEHDLIHKAVGWMLREVGKRDQHITEKFLNEHYKSMPRTMLRYAIEKFDETKRKSYLK